MPESFRWLVSNNKVADAEKVIKHIAKINGRETPKSCIDRLNNIVKTEDLTTKVKTHTLIDVLKSRDLLKKSFFLWTSWYVYFFLNIASIVKI